LLVVIFEIIGIFLGETTFVKYSLGIFVLGASKPTPNIPICLADEGRTSISSIEENLKPSTLFFVLFISIFF
jgi:hypothetical protein